MTNWRNLIVNPPKDFGYFIFKIISKHKITAKGEPEIGYVHGCIKPTNDYPNNIIILFPKEQFFSTEESFIRQHTVDPNKFKYLYLNLNEIF